MTPDLPWEAHRQCQDFGHRRQIEHEATATKDRVEVQQEEEWNPQHRN